MNLLPEHRQGFGKRAGLAQMGQYAVHPRSVAAKQLAGKTEGIIQAEGMTQIGRRPDALAQDGRGRNAILCRLFGRLGSFRLRPQGGQKAVWGAREPQALQTSTVRVSESSNPPGAVHSIRPACPEVRPNAVPCVRRIPSTFPSPSLCRPTISAYPCLTPVNAANVEINNEKTLGSRQNDYFCAKYNPSIKHERIFGRPHTGNQAEGAD